MGLGVTTPISVKTSAGGPRIAKCNTGVAIIIYEDSGFYGKVADVTGGSLALGSEQPIETTSYYPGGSYDLKQSSTDNVLFVYNDGAGGAGVGSVVARSSNTLTPSTPAEISEFLGLTISPRIAADTTSQGLAIHLYGGAQKAYSLFSVTTSVTDDVDQNQSSSLDTPISMTFLGSNKFLAMFLSSDNSIYFQVVDNTSGISQGTEDDSGYNMSGVGNYRQVTTLSTTKAVAAFGQSSSLSLLVVNTSGTSISSYGSALDIFSGTPSYVAIDTIDSSNVIVIYVESSALKVETFSISGSTITSNDDVITISGAAVASTPQIVQVDAGKWIATWVDTTGDVQASYITSGVSYALTHSADGIPGAIRVTS